MYVQMLAASAEFINDRLALHEVLGRDDALGRPFIDVNLLGRLHNPRPFVDLAEAEVAYEEGIKTIPAGGKDSELLRVKRLADLTLIQAVSGKEFPYVEYVQNTIGVTPEPVPEDELEHIEDQLNARARKLGVDAHRGPASISNPIEIQTRFRAAIAMSRHVLGRHIELPETDLEPEFFSDAGSGEAAEFITTPDGKFALRVNIHPALNHTPGNIASKGLHEYGGHFFQMASWKAAIEAREISPTNGLITLGSPEIVQAEAVAQLIDFLLPSILPPRHTDEANYQRAYNIYSNAVTHKAFLMANSEVDAKEAKKAAIEYAAEKLPNAPSARLEGLITASRDHPLARANLAGYWEGFKIVRPIMDLPERVKAETLQELYSRPLTPEGMKDLLTRARQKADRAIRIAI